jgi:hypothetical protein
MIRWRLEKSLGATRAERLVAVSPRLLEWIATIEGQQAQGYSHNSLDYAIEGQNLHEGLELAALVVRLSTFLGRPLDRLAAGAMIGYQEQVNEVW